MLHDTAELLEHQFKTGADWRRDWNWTDDLPRDPWQPGQAATGDREPDDEREGRHAGPRYGRIRITTEHTATGAVDRGPDDWGRHGAGGYASHLRPLLHHQDEPRKRRPAQGYGSRARGELWHHAGARAARSWYQSAVGRGRYSGWSFRGFSAIGRPRECKHGARLAR